MSVKHPVMFRYAWHVSWIQETFFGMAPDNNPQNGGGDMSENVQDYFETEEEREAGHVDTRSSNFECDNPDEHLGCDPGIDVQG